jgi:hypothetical protein
VCYERCVIACSQGKNDAGTQLTCAAAAAGISAFWACALGEAGAETREAACVRALVALGVPEAVAEILCGNQDVTSPFLRTQ